MASLACILCGLYIELGGGALLDHADGQFLQPIAAGAPAVLTNYYRFDRNEVSNPYASIAIGLVHSPRPWLELEARVQHVSTPAEHDAGEDSGWLRARVFPFRRR